MEVDVGPHKFHQPNSKRQAIAIPRSSAEKRRKQ